MPLIKHEGHFFFLADRIGNPMASFPYDIGYKVEHKNK